MKKLLVLWLAFFGVVALPLLAGLPYGLTERPAVGGLPRSGLGGEVKDRCSPTASIYSSRPWVPLMQESVPSAQTQVLVLPRSHISNGD